MGIAKAALWDNLRAGWWVDWRGVVMVLRMVLYLEKRMVLVKDIQKEMRLAYLMDGYWVLRLAARLG